MNERHVRGVVAVAVLVAALPLPVSAQDSLRAGLRKRTIAEDLQLFSQVLNQIRVNHPDSLDTHDLLMSAIEGLVSGADPHSYVIPAARLDSAKDAALRSGKLAPIPIEFRYAGGAPLVAAVAPGSKAMSLDILPGDELVAANGKPIAATSADELEIALAGQTNTSATLMFRRRRPDGSVVRLERAVMRQRPSDISAVPVATLLTNNTGYIRVTTFMGDKVADDLHAGLGQLEKAGMQKLILDLRGNGGGRVDEARRIAAEFLPRGAIIYTAEGRKQEVNDTARVSRVFWTSERRYPIVLLVNEGTASASELVAGALQDHDRALIVGRTTFGKSLLMQTFPLTDGSRMALVIGRLKTPCGRVIQRQYRGTSRSEYYSEAGQAGAESNRVSCKTDRGRVVYGGGGIVPDIVLPATTTPDWLARASEHGLLATWVAGYLSEAGTTLPSIDALAASPTLPPNAVASFRAYAESSHVPIPADTASASMLSKALILQIAFAKFGETGYYRLVALTDPAVDEAIRAFDQANALLAPPPG